VISDELVACRQDRPGRWQSSSKQYESQESNDLKAAPLRFAAAREAETIKHMMLESSKVLVRCPVGTEGYPLEGSAFGYVRLVHSLSEEVGRKCGCIVLGTRAKRTDCAMGRRRHMEENEGHRLSP
jgi:hypothetical protein